MLSKPLDILKFVHASNEPTALIVVTDINGGTLRAKGALMAVTANALTGYISAGCVDGDIIYQARAALKDGHIRELVYGEGSPFRDITLPCGGTIKVTVYPNPPQHLIINVLDQSKQRQAVTLELPGFRFSYPPELNLRIVGRGAAFRALADLAHTSGFQIHGQSPDADLAREYFHQFDHLKDPTQTPDCLSDPWTAVVFLFHDHDWEPILLKQALQGESFYIGAMGSAKTHALRLESLRALGVTQPERVKGPIGLIPAMRSADRLAISILAEIIDEAQRQGLLS